MLSVKFRDSFQISLKPPKVCIGKLDDIKGGFLRCVAIPKVFLWFNDLPRRIYYFHFESIAIHLGNGGPTPRNHSHPQLMAIEIKNVKTFIGRNFAQQINLESIITKFLHK